MVTQEDNLGLFWQGEMQLLQPVPVSPSPTPAEHPPCCSGHRCSEPLKKSVRYDTCWGDDEPEGWRQNWSTWKTLASKRVREEADGATLAGRAVQPAGVASRLKPAHACLGRLQAASMGEVAASGGRLRRPGRQPHQTSAGGKPAEAGPDPSNEAVCASLPRHYLGLTYLFVSEVTTALKSSSLPPNGQSRAFKSLKFGNRNRARSPRSRWGLEF